MWLLNAFSVGNLMFSIIDLDTYSDLNDLRNSTVETLFGMRPLAKDLFKSEKNEDEIEQKLISILIKCI